MVDCAYNNISCSECKSSGSDIYIDMKRGELACKKCGFVLNDYSVCWKNEIYEA